MSLIKVGERNKRTNAKQLRRNGLVPCCVYGGNLPGSISIQMSQHAANQLIHTKREGSKVTLELDGRLISTQIKEKKETYWGTKSNISVFRHWRQISESIALHISFAGGEFRAVGRPGNPTLCIRKRYCDGAG